MVANTIKITKNKGIQKLFITNVNGDGTCLIHAFLYAINIDDYRALSFTEQSTYGQAYRKALGKKLIKISKDKSSSQYKAVEQFTGFLVSDFTKIEDKIKEYVQTELFDMSIYLGDEAWFLLETIATDEKYNLVIFRTNSIYCRANDNQYNRKLIIINSVNENHYDPMSIKVNNEQVYVHDPKAPHIQDLIKLIDDNCAGDAIKDNASDDEEDVEDSDDDEEKMAGASDDNDDASEADKDSDNDNENIEDSDDNASEADDDNDDASEVEDSDDNASDDEEDADKEADASDDEEEAEEADKEADASDDEEEAEAVEDIYDTYIINKNEISFKNYADIPFLKHNYTILNFSKEQAHDEIYNLTEQFNFRGILSEIESIEKESIKNDPERSAFNKLLKTNWFIPIATYKKHRMDFDFSTLPDIDSETVVQTSLVKFIKTAIETNKTHLPLFTSKEKDTLETDTHVIWEHSVTSDEMLTDFIDYRTSKDFKPQSLMWSQAKAEEYTKSQWSKYLEDELKKIIEFKRFVQGEDIDMSGFFINNAPLTKNYHVFDCDDYFKTIEDIVAVTSAIDVVLETPFKTNVSAKITELKNGILHIKADDEIFYYDALNPATTFLLYIKNHTYEYQYKKTDFYDSNILFICKTKNTIDIVEHFIPSVNDYLIINRKKLMDIQKINSNLVHYHNTDMTSINEYTQSLLMQHYVFVKSDALVVKDKDDNIAESIELSSSFKSDFDVLNFDDKKYISNFNTLSDSDNRRFNYLLSTTDKGLSIIYDKVYPRSLTNVKQYEIQKQLAPMKSVTEKEIYDIKTLKTLKTSITNLGKRDFEDFNATKTKLVEHNTKAKDYIENAIKFFNKKHEIQPKIMRYSIEKQSREISLFDDIEIHHQPAEYDGPDQYIAPTILANNAYESEILLLGPKVSDNQLGQLSKFIENFINYVNKAKKSKMTNNSEMLIVYGWVIIFVQVSDTLFDKKKIMDEYKTFFSTKGFPINNSDATFDVVYGDDKNNSILAYTSLFFLNRFKITNQTQKDIMNGLYNNIKDILRFQPDIAAKLQSNKLIKDTKTTQNSTAAKYLKMFKPYNQDITAIELAKNIDKDTIGLTKNSFGEVYSMSMIKPPNKNKNTNKQQIITQKVKQTFSVKDKTQVTNEEHLNAFLSVNTWIPEELATILKNAAEADDDDVALSQYLESNMRMLFDYLGNKSIEKYFFNIVKEIETKGTDMIALLDRVGHFNLNTYLSDVIHHNNKGHVYRFMTNYSTMDVFKDNAQVLHEHHIRDVDVLLKTNLSASRKIYTSLAIFISSVIAMYNKIFNNKNIPATKTFEEIGKFIEDNKKMEVSHFNRFIINCLDGKMESKIIIDKEVLRRKYNLLMGEERQRENTRVANMTEEEIVIHFAFKALKLELEMNPVNNTEQQDMADDNDFGDGDGDGTYDDF